MGTPVRLSLLVCGLALLAEPIIVGAPTTDFHYEIPRRWTVVESGVVPVLGRLPMDLRFHRATLHLDGEAIDASPAVVRRRWWEGKGVDLIASVSAVGLTPGWHRLTAVLEPTPDSARVIGTARSAQTEELETWFRFEPRPFSVSFSASDGEGDARFARVSVFTPGGDLVDIGNPTDAVSDPSARDTPRVSCFLDRSGGTEFLEKGTYVFVASGGIRDGVDIQTVDIGADTEIHFSLPRLIETPGELTADLHVHTARSSDAFIPDTERFRALAAASVDVAVITEHNRVRDPRPALELLDMVDAIDTVPGVEFRIGPSGSSIGHGNAFPLKPGVAAVKPGEKSPGQVFAAWRSHHESNPIAGDDTPLLVQLNHPRGIQFRPDKKHRFDAHGLFEELGFEPEKALRNQSDKRARSGWRVPGGSLLDFDAIEVLNRFSVAGWNRVRADWFALLNRGHQITATGNSDSHTAQLEPVGFPVNLVASGDFEVGSFVEAIREGRLRVSSGPLVSLTVEAGDQEIRPSHAIHRVAGQVKVTIRVQAVDWVPVDEVRLVINGEVVFQAPVGPSPVDQVWRKTLVLGRDAWVIAEAGWPLDTLERPEGTVFSMVAPGHVPIGFTNPIWLDVDGDGLWSTTAGLEGLGPQ